MGDGPLLAEVGHHRQDLPSGDLLRGTAGHHLPVLHWIWRCLLVGAGLTVAAGVGCGGQEAVAVAGAAQGGGAQAAAAQVTPAEIHLLLSGPRK